MEGLGPSAKRSKSVSSEQDEDEKRRNFLERNRQGQQSRHINIWLAYKLTDPDRHSYLAALKCRQRKKAWLNDLQVKVESLAQENEQLTIQANSFRDEIIHLKTLLHAHKECQVTKDDSSLIRTALEKPIPPPAIASVTNEDQVVQLPLDQLSFMLFFTSLSFELARLHIPHCHVINIYFVLLLLIGIDQQLCDIESDVRLGTQSKEELISQTFRENVTASTADEKVFITMEPVVLSGSQCKHWLVLRCPNCSGLSTSRSRLKIFSSAHSSLFFLSPSC